MPDNLELIQPFGPQIGIMNIPENINRGILSLCFDYEHDSSRRINSLLAGLIEKEFSIKTELINSNAMPIIKQAVLDYLSSANSVYTQFAPFDVNDITCTDAWCNIQEVGEFNPLHSHPYDDIVVVFFPLIDIDVNHHTYTRSANKESPGSLLFHYGSGDPRFGKTTYKVTPQTGKLYVFPASLGHYTIPLVNDNDMRVSVSCNFSLWDLRIKKT
jgi:hypothetical protein